MDFYALQDMKMIPQSVWDTLAVDNEAILTDGNKPVALLVNISGSNLEELLKAVRQIKALDSFNAM